MSQDEIDRLLVGELRVLDELRREHVSRYPGSRIEREDPDIQRLLEAMALFSVRTRLSVQRNLQLTWRRLFASYFDFLLAPLPSCAIAQAQISPRVVESTTIDRGAQLRLTTQSGLSATFTTGAELRILPIALESVERVSRGGKQRLFLRFTTRFPRTDAVGLLRLFVSCAGHYESALQMQYQLRAHLLRAHVSYDAVGDSGEGAPCEVSFGTVHEAPLQDEPMNPQDGIRRFFHFPEQELYVNVQVPQSPRPWQSFVLCFELSPDYPADPEPGRDTFQLFTVPIENRVRVPAAQILVDGTSSSHGIRHADAGQRYSLLRVRGVYRQSDRGLFPMRPAVLSATDNEDSYEIEERPDDRHAGHYLMVRAPAALVSPIKLQADCEWHQPWFAPEAVGKLRVTLPHRSLEGVTLQLQNGVRSAHDSALSRNAQGLLQFLSLRMKPVLSREELLRVLDVIGTVATGPYRRLPSLLRQLRVEPALDSALRGSGLRHVYHLVLERFDGREECLVWHFLAELQLLLDSWNAEATVELLVDAGGASFAVPLPGGIA